MEGQEIAPSVCFFPRGSGDCNRVWHSHSGVVEIPIVIIGSARPGLEFSDVAFDRTCQTGKRRQ